MIRSFNHTYSLAHDLHGAGGVQVTLSGTGFPAGGIEENFNNAADALLWLAHQYEQQAKLIEREVLASRRQARAPSLILPSAYRRQ